MTTIYSNGRFLTAAPESDIPIRRGEDSVYARETRQLRDALVDRRGDLVQALAPLLSTPYGIPKTVRLGTRVDVPYRGKPTRSLGWLAWAVWHEGHGLNGGEYSEGISSSGCVEALVNAGIFDWDALRLFPNQKWAHHPGFKALQSACVERMAKLPKKHRLLLESNDTLREGPLPPADSSSSRNEDSWLVLPVLAGRVDVVQHWFDQGGRMPLGFSYHSLWRQAWERVLDRPDVPGRPDEATENVSRSTTLHDRHVSPAEAIVAMLEHQVIARNVPRSSHRETLEQPPAYLREEVLSLIGLGVDNARRPDGGSFNGREALVQSLQRVIQRWPLDLSPCKDGDRLRLSQEWGSQVLPPFAQTTLIRLEQQVLTDTLWSPPDKQVTSSRRRL